MILVSVIGGVVLLCGCCGVGGFIGLQRMREAAVKTQRKNQLLAIGLAYFDYVKTHEQRAPAKAEDLRPLLTETPGAYEALADGSVVFVYGISPDEMVPPGPEGFPVLAYDKNTPESGGWVVYANGEVEQVTAAEFASKPKLRKRGEK